MKLTLEINQKYKKDSFVKKLEEIGILITPPLSKDKDWMFRVQVGSDQSIIGFPKFSTIGIGFEREEDFNTNLPYSCDVVEIYEHIKHNKGKGPKKQNCLEAIKLIQKSASDFIGIKS